MSRGNINRKYLRRRKSWLQRNWTYLLTWAAIIVIFLAFVTLIAFAFKKFVLDKKIKNYDENHNNVEIVQETTKAVTWHELKEQTTATETVYTPPANVALPYYIKVNRAMCCVTVYGIDSENKYTIPVKAFACSVGREAHDTIVGENYRTTDKYEWRLMVDQTYGMYAYRIYGSYLFHSVPYYTASHGSLESEEFNKLGTPASLGCVRMCVRDVKWIYDNCPVGTGVTIYDDETTPGPLGKPEVIKIPLNSPNSGWDPTDPDVNNPWLKESAKITGAKDLTVKIGEEVDFLKGVKATDTCGNDITDKIQVVGKYTFDLAGSYDISYVVTDLLGSKATQKIKLTVTE